MITLRPCCRVGHNAKYSGIGHLARRVPCVAPSLHRRAALGEEVTQPKIAKLTDEILAAEAKLAALFEPGRPMPRAGVVSGLRHEVSEMKAKLADIVGSSEIVVSTTKGEDEVSERARLTFLEVERLLIQKSGGSSARDDSTAWVVLEAENERLRLEATALLLRQQQLEELVEKHNLVRRNGSRA